MPWMKGNPPPGQYPDEYRIPVIEAAISFNEKDLEVAVGWRKYYTQLRETFLDYQKQCGREDREFARFFRDEANECLKQQRGWHFVIEYLNGTINLTSEEIAPYIDLAFATLSSRE